MEEWNAGTQTWSDAWTSAATTNMDPTKKHNYLLLYKMPMVGVVAYAIIRYTPPIIIGLGLVGNVLSMVTLMSPGMRHAHSNVLLFLLAMVDSGVLLGFPLRSWINALSGYDIRQTGRFGCKAFYFFFTFLQHLSSCTLALMTVERAIAVSLPLKVKQICTKRRVLMAYGCLALCLVIINLHFFETSDLAIIDSGWQCRLTDKYRHFERAIWYWIDALLNFFLPFTVILVGNVIIITRLAAARQKRSAELKVGGADGKRGVSSTTLTLLLVTCTYVILVFPRAFVLISMHFDMLKMYSFEGTMRFLFMRQFTEKLSNLNNAINFFLYCLSGPKFRRALLAAVCRVRRAPRRPATSGATSDTSTLATTLPPPEKMPVSQHQA